MIRVCSQCKRVMTAQLDEEQKDDRISHGICAQCLAILEDKLRETPNPLFPRRGKVLTTKTKENT